MFGACGYVYHCLSFDWLASNLNYVGSERIVSLSSRPNVSRVECAQFSIFLNFLAVCFSQVCLFSTAHFCLVTWFELPRPETLPLFRIPLYPANQVACCTLYATKIVVWEFVFFSTVARPPDFDPVVTAVVTGARRGLLLLWRARSLPWWRTRNLRLWAGPASMAWVVCWRRDQKCEWVLENIVAHQTCIYHIHFYNLLYIIICIYAYIDFVFYITFRYSYPNIILWCVAFLTGSSTAVAISTLAAVWFRFGFWFFLCAIGLVRFMGDFELCGSL